MFLVSYVLSEVRKIVEILFSRPQSLSDGMLLGRLRKKIHLVEKNRVEGLSVSRWDYAGAERLYQTAFSRGIVSGEERVWIESALYGKSTGLAGMDSENWCFSRLSKNRRSIRIFSEDAVSDEVLNRVFEDVRWAPSSCNRQPWIFVLTRDAEKLEFLATSCGQDFVCNASAAVICSFEKDAYEPVEGGLLGYVDVGIACQQLLLSCEDKGLACCPVNFLEDRVGGQAIKATRELFGLPDSIIPCMIVALGNSGGEKPLGGRKGVSETLFFEEYGR